MSIIDRLNASIDGLSPAEQRVGRWLAENVVAGANASLSTVARQAGVSEPTVIRFCRSLGLDGFRDLRTEFIAARERPESYLHQDVKPSDTATEAAAKVLDGSIRSLVDLRSTLERMPFDAAAADIAGARQIVFMGMGASGLVAEDAKHKFFRLGIPCTVAMDPQTILQHASVTQARDVVVAISHTGRWPDLIEAMKTASSQGAKCIAVTTPDSPLAETVSHLFACTTREDTSAYTPMTSRLTQLAILDALQIAAALAMGPDAEAKLRVTKEALTNYRSRWGT